MLSSSVSTLHGIAGGQGLNLRRSLLDLYFPAQALHMVWALLVTDCHNDVS